MLIFLRKYGEICRTKEDIANKILRRMLFAFSINKITDKKSEYVVIMLFHITRLI